MRVNCLTLHRTVCVTDGLLVLCVGGVGWWCFVAVMMHGGVVWWCSGGGGGVVG